MLRNNVTSLGKILDDWGHDDVRMLLETFKCREPEIEDFLVRDAIPFHRKHRSRTYLFLSDDRTKVLAYVTLGIKCLKVSKDNRISNKIKKDIDVYKDTFQSYLIGELGKADGVGKGVGKNLIDFAIGVFSKSFNSIGCRTIRVDCKKELIRFYEENGFRLISQEESGGDLYHMVMLF